MARRLALTTPSRLPHAALLLALVACGGGESSPPVEQLAGRWRATRIEYVGAGGAGSVELVAQGGSGSLVLRAEGTGLLTLTPLGKAPWVIDAPWSLDGAFLTLGTATNNLNWAIELAADELRLSGAQASYDFDGDGASEPAKLNLALSREP